MKVRAIRRLCVAARGLVARRVAATARRLGIETVGLLREVDAGAGWAGDLDYTVYLSGEGEVGWPRPERVVEAALDAGCDAIHPGWGRLARSPAFTEMLAQAGILGVGPGTIPLAAVADRGILRRLAEQLGIPTVPGSDPTDEEGVALAWLSWAGFPAIIRPADDTLDAGPTLVHDEAAGRAALAELLPLGPVVLERRVEAAREIELLVLGDGTGNCAALGAGDITARTAAGRLLCEAPAAGLTGEAVGEMRAHALRLAEHLDWRGLGAARFLVPPDGRPYLLTFRPGLQPWHAAWEALLDVDLVEVQLGLAAGTSLAGLPVGEEGRGFAVAVRLAAAGPGRLDRLVLPAGVLARAGPTPGDAVLAGDELAVLAARATARTAVVVLMHQALREVAVEGPSSGLPQALRLLGAPAFWRGPLDRDAAAALLDGPAPGG